MTPVVVHGLLLGAIMLVGVALRWFQIGAHDLWFDEAASVFFADRPHLVASVDFHPPLYYDMLKLWSSLFGRDEAALRSLSAVGSVLTIPIVWMLGTRIGGRCLGLLSAALIAMAPMHIWYAQETRSYAWLSCFMACMQLSVVMISAPGCSIVWHGLFVASSVAAVYTAYGAVFFLLALPLLLMEKSYRSQWRVLLIDGILIGVCSAPLWSVASKQLSRVAGGFWIPPVDCQRLVSAIGNLIAGYEHNSFWLVPLSVALCCFGLWRVRAQQRFMAVCQIVLMCGPIISCMAVSLWRPLYLARPLLAVTVPFWIAVASGMLALRKGVVRISAIVLIAVMLTSGLYRQYVDVLPRAKPPFRPVFDFLLEQMGSGDVVVHVSPVTVYPFLYYGGGLLVHLRLYSESSSGQQVVKALLRSPNGPSGNPQSLLSIDRLPVSGARRMWVLSGSWERNGQLDENAQYIRAWLRRQRVPIVSVCVEDVLVEAYDFGKNDDRQGEGHR